jgi:hypothetical protein
MFFTSAATSAGDLIGPTEQCLRRRGLPADGVTSNDEVVHTGRRAIGVVLSVPATAMGVAADLALDVAQRAFEDAGAPFEELYELTVWPPRRDELR